MQYNGRITRNRNEEFNIMLHSVTVSEVKRGRDAEDEASEEDTKEESDIEDEASEENEESDDGSDDEPVDGSKPAVETFEVGRKYTYDELPDAVQNDVDVQIDEYNQDPNEYYYVFEIIPWKNLDVESWGMDIDEMRDNPRMKKLMRSIEKHGGIINPPVGMEGNHRQLASYFLGLNMPYFRMEEKDEEDDDEKSSPSSSSLVLSETGARRCGIIQTLRASTCRPHDTATLRARFVPSAGILDLTSGQGFAYARIFGRRAVTNDERYVTLQANIEGFLATARDEQILLMPTIPYQATKIAANRISLTEFGSRLLAALQRAPQQKTAQRLSARVTTLLNFKPAVIMTETERASLYRSRAVIYTLLYDEFAKAGLWTKQWHFQGHAAKPYRSTFPPKAPYYRKIESSLLPNINGAR